MGSVLHETVERDLRRFGDFSFDPETGELWRGTEVVPLRPMAARALSALTERPGEVVLREELRERLWPETAVAWDQSLNQCIRQVRRALRDDALEPEFVETIPRRGYRFRTEVVRHRGRISAPPEGDRGRWRVRRAFLAGAATAFSIPILFLIVCAVLARSAAA